MCGIAGIFSYSWAAPPVDRHELTTIRDAMAARGPDGAGLWMAPTGRVGFAHRRLSIIDLSNGGDQPMHTADGRYSIVFNGEIYNYLDVKRTLAAKGYLFRSSSDTEVLLYAYAEYGRDMVLHLRGMYTIAIWDSKTHSLFLARDPFGIKPLYYCTDGGVIRFASQVKALRTSTAISASPSAAGQVGFFTWGFVPEPYTLYEAIKCLPAGSTMMIKDGVVGQPTPFFNLADEFDKFSDNREVHNSTPELHERLRSVMLDSVKHHLIADVPVGLFLSSGIDSTCLTSLASELSSATLHTLTLGFDEYRGTDLDETPLATKFADVYKVHSDVRWINRDNFAASASHILASMDQPSIDGVNTYLVSHAAAQAGMKVALSGLGGDELFGTYPSFQDVPRSVRALGKFPGVPGFGRGFRAITAPILKRFTSPKYAGLFEFGGSFEGAYLLRRGLYMPWELTGILDPDLVKAGWDELKPMLTVQSTIPKKSSDFSKVSALEIGWYVRNQLLRDSDWAGMAHSLEIRTPMVDIDLFRKLGPMLAHDRRPTKHDLASACAGPEAGQLLARKKSGFAVPVGGWIRELGMTSGKERGLRDWANTVYANHIPRSPKAAKERILVFRVGNLGDTLVSLPAIAKIRTLHPAASLCLMTNDDITKQHLISTWTVAKPFNYFDHVIRYKSRANIALRATETLGLVRRIRQFSPQRVYNLTPKRTRWQSRRDTFFFRTLAGVSQFAQRVQPPEPPAALSGQLPRLEAEWRRLYGEVTDTQPEPYRLPVSLEDRLTTTVLLSELDPAGSLRFIAIGPGSKMPAKLWPKERFSELGTRILAAEPDTYLLILGGPEDAALGVQLSTAWEGRAKNLAGKLSIAGSAALLERCTLYVGNDTGTMHLAAMVGVACVAIFSARDYPGIWEPYGQHHIVLRKEIDCAGCMLEVCRKRRNECLKMISVDEVFQAIVSKRETAAPLNKC
jgi:asparagine synthase (glutamine-hydrolysing)